jgi:hypothetical protein
VCAAQVSRTPLCGAIAACPPSPVPPGHPCSAQHQHTPSRTVLRHAVSGSGRVAQKCFKLLIHARAVRSGWRAAPRAPPKKFTSARFASCCTVSDRSCHCMVLTKCPKHNATPACASSSGLMFDLSRQSHVRGSGAHTWVKRVWGTLPPSTPRGAWYGPSLWPPWCQISHGTATATPIVSSSGQPRCPAAV